MSIKVMTAVWECSNQKGSALLLLLAIADFADDDGYAYPSVQTLAKKARASERNTHYLLKHLQASGELEIRRNEGPRGCNLCRVQSSVGVQPGVLGGATQRHKGVQPVAPKPSLEPSLEPLVLYTEGVNGQKPSAENQAVWPDWYATLWAIPGFKFPLAHAQAWLDGKKISADHAETTAYALKSKWPGPARNPYRDPWATFQHWVKRPPIKELVTSSGRTTRREAQTDAGVLRRSWFGEKA